MAGLSFDYRLFYIIVGHLVINKADCEVYYWDYEASEFEIKSRCKQGL